LLRGDEQQQARECENRFGHRVPPDTRTMLAGPLPCDNRLARSNRSELRAKSSW
jgi:hypothetical protein